MVTQKAKNARHLFARLLFVIGIILMVIGLWMTYYTAKTDDVGLGSNLSILGLSILFSIIAIDVVSRGRGGIKRKGKRLLGSAYCTRCGAKIESGSMFCPGCGRAPSSAPIGAKVARGSICQYRVILAYIMAILIPGTGHIVVGRARRGIVIFAIAVLLIFMVVILVTLDPPLANLIPPAWFTLLYMFELYDLHKILRELRRRPQQP